MLGRVTRTWGAEDPRTRQPSCVVGLNSILFPTRCKWHRLSGMRWKTASNTYSGCLVPTPVSSKPRIEMPVLHLGLILAIEIEEVWQTNATPGTSCDIVLGGEEEILTVFAGLQLSQTWIPASRPPGEHVCANTQVTLTTDTLTIALRKISETLVCTTCMT